VGGIDRRQCHGCFCPSAIVSSPGLRLDRWLPSPLCSPRGNPTTLKGLSKYDYVFLLS